VLELFTRPIPSPEELELLMRVGHAPQHIPRRRDVPKDQRPSLKAMKMPIPHHILTKRCLVCQTLPRTFLLTASWVQSYYPYLLREMLEDLPGHLRNAFEANRVRGSRADVLRLAWCVREADHLNAMGNRRFVRRLTRWTKAEEAITVPMLFDLTYLPPCEIGFLQTLADPTRYSSTDRDWRSSYWSQLGITRPRGAETSQLLWTACAGPLAVTLRPFVKGRKQDSWGEKDTDPVPDALWSEVVALWRARYPERTLPSPASIRRRVQTAFPLK